MSLTTQQRKAFELWCNQVAEEMISVGFDMRDLTVEIKPTRENVREGIFKTVMESMFDVKSTNDLDNKKLNDCIDVLNNAFSQKLNFYVPFPSEDELRMRSQG